MNRFLPAPVNPFCTGINSGPWTVIHREKCTAGPESECTRLALGQPPHTKSGGTECNTTPRRWVQHRAAVGLRTRIQRVCSRRAITTQQMKGGNVHIFPLVKNIQSHVFGLCSAKGHTILSRGKSLSGVIVF